MHERSLRVRGGSARATGVRTRGGRSSLPTRGGSRTGRVRGRGRGCPRSSVEQRPSASCAFNLIAIEDLPAGEPIEQALTERSKRSWNPRNYEPDGEDIPVILSSPAIPPSPAMYVECGGSGTSTPSSRYNIQISVHGSRSPSPSHKRVRRSLCPDQEHDTTNRDSISSLRRPLRDSEICYLLHYGSDDDDSDDESQNDNDEIVPMIIPRAAGILMDTPDDEEIEIDTAAATKPLVTSSAPSIISAPTSPARDTGMKPSHFFEFDWGTFPDSPIPPTERRESFKEHSGPTVAVSDPYEIFRLIWDQEFMEFIVQETNRYAQQLAAEMLDGGELQASSRITEWKETNVDELLVFFGILLAMGIVIKNRVEEYWNTEQNIFSTPGFKVYMSLRRFQLLSRCLHFNNSENLRNLNLDPSQAKLFKVEPVISHLNSKFTELYIMKQNIALDESLLQWKGWLNINQFIPNKAAAVGIKTYEICESQTGYLWRFKIHAHKASPTVSEADPFTASTPALVLNLIKGLEHKGYTLWMDNFYNSPALARKLKSIGFDCVGTLRTNRKYVPTELTNLKKSQMKPGQVVGYTSGDVDCIIWRDQNRVATISTYHGNAVSTKNGVTKLILIRDYNICMGGVDKKDQMLAAFPIERKRTQIWYKKLFKRLLNVSVLNAYIIHKQTATEVLDHRGFRKNLVESLLRRHSIKMQPYVFSARVQDTIFEVSRHHPAEYPRLTSLNSTNRHRHPCKVCGKRTVTYCVGCDKPVCVFTCFVKLHN
ncbi:piggyBac transposable element-derived protein 4 isoform X2 [Bombyx mori]|uniref:PiggyBac transposable element-derived protein domain-containing protein n=1 Tax=Bombyx mori TaxID=7091 RepID=A0A8R2M4K9_BOMMO|nr:piggyBac transposable element-derived protein 4 isoform X2 [Bombyx mori]